MCASPAADLCHQHAGGPHGALKRYVMLCAGSLMHSPLCWQGPVNTLIFMHLELLLGSD